MQYGTRNLKKQNRNQFFVEFLDLFQLPSGYVFLVSFSVLVPTTALLASTKLDVTGAWVKQMFDNLKFSSFSAVVCMVY